MRKQCLVIQFFNLMTFSRPILMIKFFGNQSSVQSVMYLEADTRHDVTHIYTATCTGAAETSWQAEQAVRLYLQTYTYRAFLSISLIPFKFGLYFNQKNKNF